MQMVQINMNGIERTLNLLKQAGERQIECVVLWLASKQNGLLNVQSIYRPQQTADFDFFHIPQESVLTLLTHLRQNRFMVAAQVHSHPNRAFHSLADDKWTIIRHVGGLSVVIPNFAATTTSTSFIQDSSVFRLSESNKWIEISSREVSQYYRVTL